MSSAENEAYSGHGSRALRLLTGHFALLSHGAIWLTLLAVLVRKTVYIQENLGAGMGCDGCLYLPVLQHDSIVFGVMLLLYVLSSWISARRVASSALRAIFFFIT